MYEKNKSDGKKKRKICHRVGKNGMLEKFFCDDSNTRSPIIRSRKRPRPHSPPPFSPRRPPSPPSKFLTTYLKPQRRMRLALDRKGNYHGVPEELPNDKRYKRHFEDLEKKSTRYTDPDADINPHIREYNLSQAKKHKNKPQLGRKIGFGLKRTGFNHDDYDEHDDYLTHAVRLGDEMLYADLPPVYDIPIMEGRPISEAIEGMPIFEGDIVDGKRRHSKRHSKRRSKRHSKRHSKK